VYELMLKLFLQVIVTA